MISRPKPKESLLHLHSKSKGVHIVNRYNDLHSHTDILQNLSEHVTIQEYARRLALFHTQKKKKK